MNTAFNGNFSSSFQRMWQSVIKVLEMNAPEEGGSPDYNDAQYVVMGFSVGLFLDF